MSRRRYPDEIGDRPGGWTRWIQPVRKGYRMQCCDCGLVHEIDTRITKGRVQWRVRRNNRATAAVRRWRKSV